MIEEEGGVATGNPYRTYPKLEFEDTLWKWFNQFEDAFPCEVRCDFIEISPNISSYRAKAFWRQDPNSQFIRVSEEYIERADNRTIKRTMLHEMVHLYTFQKGFEHEITDSSPMFKWLCGQVGTHINSVNTMSMKWQELAEPFLFESVIDE